MYCNILVTKPFDQYFTYKFDIDRKIERGNLVLVSFGKKNDQIGLVYDILDDSHDDPAWGLPRRLFPNVS